MPKKIKLQDLSIVNFDQQPDVEGIKGGAAQCTDVHVGYTLFGRWYYYTYRICDGREVGRWEHGTVCPPAAGSMCSR